MSYSLTINGAERKQWIDRDTFIWNTAKNGKPDSINVQLTTPDPATDNIEPVVDQVVIFSINSVVKFEGRVLRVGKKLRDSGIAIYQIECIDYSRDANKGELIAEIYTDQTVNSIIADIISRYPQLSAFTDNNVNCTEVIDYFFVDHKRFYEVLRELADRVGYDFYIDNNKDIHFYQPGSEMSLFNVTADGGEFIRDSLEVQENGDQIVNFIVVEGGLYDASETETESFTADGSQTDFELNGLYSGVTVTVAGTPQDVGAFGIHDAADYDCLYDYNGRKVLFRNDNKPTVGQSVEVTGYQKLPVLVQVEEGNSVATHGILPKKIKDASLKTIDSAKQYAFAELGKYADEMFSGSFSTYYTSLRAGQRIQITHQTLGINSSFDIQSTNTRFYGLEGFVTSVRIASAEEVDAVGILARILNKQNQSVSAQEVLQIYKLIRERVDVADTVAIDPRKRLIEEDVNVSDSLDQENNKTLVWVHAPYYPSSFADSKRQFLHDSTPLHA